MTAPPVRQGAIAAQASANSGPALRWIAPQTPPPGIRDSLAALTIASRAKVVMSPVRISIRWVCGRGMAPPPLGGRSHAPWQEQRKQAADQREYRSRDENRRQRK